MISPEAGDAGEAAAYWARWEVVVCAAIIVVAMLVAMSVILKAKGRRRLRAADGWTTCWRTVSPAWLLACRSAALAALVWVFFELVLMEGSFSFYFYTQWTFLLVIFYFLIATLVSIHGCWIHSKQYNENNNGFIKGEISKHNQVNLTYNLLESKNTNKMQSFVEEEIVEPNAGFWIHVMQIAYQTSAGASVLTDIMFWFVLVPFLSPEGFTMNLVMGSVHALNIVFLLIDTALNNLPFPWFRMAYFIIFGGIYITFLWIINACGSSWWPYPFLELAVPWAPLCYLALALVHIPCYGVYIMAVKAKIKYFPQWFPEAYMNNSF